MPSQIRISLFLFTIGITACQTPEVNYLLSEHSATSLVEEVIVLSPEKRIWMNKISDRCALKTIIDQAPQARTIPFACTPQHGGLLFYIIEEEQLKGIRLSLSQEQTTRSTRWYYQNTTLVLVTHESNQWKGNMEQVKQTIFHVDNQEMLQVLHRVVETPASHLEIALDTTSFAQVPLQEQIELWQQLIREEQELKQYTNTNQYTTYFCS